MTKPSRLPLQGKTIRFAPGAGGQPSTTIWKLWADGSEVYATLRSGYGNLKFSVHSSGQIHLRKGAKDKQDLAPILPLGTSGWFHALEIRFLPNERAKAPFKQREFLKNKSAFIINAPHGEIVFCNLLIGAAGAPIDRPLPIGFQGAGLVLWRTRLRDGRVAVLVARSGPMNQENADRLKHLREELGLRVTFGSSPHELTYVELHHIFWSEGGNVVFVAALGSEAIRFESEPPSADTPAEALLPRTFQYHSGQTKAEVFAPDGRRVAEVELAMVDKFIELTMGRPTRVNIGLLRLTLDRSALIPGSAFMASPAELKTEISIGGCASRERPCFVIARFDGQILSADVRLFSSSVRSGTLSPSVAALEEREEIVLRVPDENITVSVTLDSPTTTSQLLGYFLLRQIS